MYCMVQANQAMERGMLESNLDALRTENHSLQQRLDKALQELVRAATPSNPAVLRAFKVCCSCPACCRSRFTFSSAALAVLGQTFPEDLMTGRSAQWQISVP